MQGFAITTSKGDFIKSAKIYTHLGIAKASRRSLFGFALNSRKAKEYNLDPWDDQLKPVVDNELSVMYPIVRISLETMQVDRVVE